MTRAPDWHRFPVEAFCLHCGLIQDGQLHAATFSKGRSSEQVVIVHCESCGGVSRHVGSVIVCGVTGRMSVIGRVGSSE